jgi:hypothetical protein
MDGYAFLLMNGMSFFVILSGVEDLGSDLKASLPGSEPEMFRFAQHDTCIVVHLFP